MRLLARCVARGPHAATLLVAPENLGKCSFIGHASIWQFKELRQMARKFDLRRMVFHQCHLGASDWPRPTGVLASHRLPPQTSVLGWPKFNLADDGSYTGPLGPHCHCGQRHVSMLKQGGEYKVPERSLSTAAINLLAAAVANAMADEAIQNSVHAESLLREGFDTFGALRNKDWIPETTFPADQTEDEEDLAPPSSESPGELTDNELDEQRHASQMHRELQCAEHEEVRLIIQYSIF